MEIVSNYWAERHKIPN